MGCMQVFWKRLRSDSLFETLAFGQSHVKVLIQS